MKKKFLAVVILSFFILQSCSNKPTCSETMKENIKLRRELRKNTERMINDRIMLEGIISIYQSKMSALRRY